MWKQEDRSLYRRWKKHVVTTGCGAPDSTGGGFATLGFSSGDPGLLLAHDYGF